MIRRSLIVVTAFIVTTISSPATACSCAWGGTFVEYAARSDGVIRARVASYGEKLTHGDTLYESMTVEVISVIKGELRYESIELLGDPGFMCRSYVDSRSHIVGNEYLIAIHGDEAVQPFGGCGESWVAIVDGVVQGHDWTDTGHQEYSMPLEDLLEILDID